MDASTNSKIRLLCSQGDKLSKLGDYDRAVSKYYEALTLLPDMHGRNNISAFLYASIGEAYWNMKDYENAGQSFCEAYECPGMNENAQITLRIGQCLIECGDVENARDYLRHAVRLGGDEIIKNVDRRYIQVLYPDTKNGQQQARDHGVYASGVTRSAPYGGAASQQPADAAPGGQAGYAYTAGTQQGVSDRPLGNGASDGNTRGGAAPENGGSSFSFVGEIFGEQQRPAESSRFTMSAEDMKPKEPQPAQDETDIFAYPEEQRAPENRQESPSRTSYPEEKPEKQGFFSRIFGRKK